MKKPANRLIFALAAILILSAAPAGAQTQVSQQHQNVKEAANQEFDRQTLEKYAAASAELWKIQNELTRELKGVQDQKKVMKIEQEAARKKISAVEDQGLDLQTYDRIANQAHVDPELRKEINQIIEGRDI